MKVPPCFGIAAMLLFGFVLNYSAGAQPRIIRMDQPGSNPEEVTIAINPMNPDNIVAGSNLRYYYYSFDGGETWVQKQLPEGTWGDPSVTFDKMGRAYIANLRYGWDAIVVRYSDDGGKTWSEGVPLPGPSSAHAKAGSFYESSLQDKEWIVSDMGDGPYSGNVYVAWTDFTLYGSTNPADSSAIVFARSTNRGESFEPFVRVSDSGGDAIDSDNTVEGAMPAVGPNGEVYLCWAGPKGIYFDRSFDGGITWGEDRVITDQPGGWNISISGISRSNGFPVTVTDMSQSVYRGTIYVNWVDERNGDPDVFILASSDKGETWRGPVRVNDDPVGNGKEQFFTWAAVDPGTGELAIVFYDRRNYATDSTDVCLARSSDGGRTFRNERISRTAFYPSPMVFFGDYNGIAALNGRIRPVWTQLNQGRLSIHTCLIDSEANSSEPLPAHLNGVNIDVWPNPLNSVNGSDLTIHLTLDKTAHVNLEMYDIVGKRVASVFHGELHKGRNLLNWSAAGLAPGNYLCRVLTDVRPNQPASTIVHGRMVTILR